MMTESKLTRVLISAGRMNILPPGGVDLGHGTRAAYAWFVWERGYTGEPTVRWFEPAK